MRGMNRRTFGLMAGAASMTLAAPMIARTQTKPRVVVIGGGSGGATAARYIAQDSENAIDVTLVEMNQEYTTCYFSNLYFGGFRTFESITHSYDRLASGYGVTMAFAMATGIDRDAKTVPLSDGSSVPYDKLVISPGIDLIYDSVDGYSKEVEGDIPHSWKPGEQTRIMKAQLDALEDGQNIVMVAPPNPYRCPPGPYERISMFAHMLKSKGYSDSTITILDPKPKFSKQGLFQAGWEQHYPGMVEWLGPDVHGGIKGIDPSTKTVMTDLDDFEADMLTVIPKQKAGAIATDAGLANDSGFCPIDPYTMKAQGNDDIYILGDASIAGDMPKSGFSANSQAKVAAMSVRHELIDSRMFPARYSNTCWSLIATDDGVKVGAQYSPTDEKIASTSSFISQNGESAEVRKETYEESIGWYKGITTDMFGTT
ncbi:MAG: NAD(P)/FAD-dependent oxidoreductase [Pseudomonadota bacterium]